MEVQLDSQGHPWVIRKNGTTSFRPCSNDYERAHEFAQELHAWNDRITEAANRAFDQGLRQALRGG